MTYVLDQTLAKVMSPVVLVLPDGTELRYANGAEAVCASFERRYSIAGIRASGSVVEVRLRELDGPSVNWVGEEAVDAGNVSFF